MTTLLPTLADISTIVPSRNFNMSYIVFDCLFLVFLVTLLIIKKRYLSLLWGLVGGLIYFGVDFGLFYCASHTREVYIEGQLLSTAGHALFLAWFSLSYGIPNFVFIWMGLSKDKLFKVITTLIVGWWIVVPTLSQFGQMDVFKSTFLGSTITTLRQTGNFHWIMAMFLIVGYGSFIAYIILKDQEHLKENIKTLFVLNAIGIFCQFSWEFPLLMNGIRPLNEQSLQTLLINSAIETNSGMVYFYLFHKFISKKVGLGEDLHKVSQ